MTATEKLVMENQDHKPLMDLPKIIREAMERNKEHLLRLYGDGTWRPLKSPFYMGGGYIFKVDPNAATEPLESRGARSVVYAVFCGSDGIYKVDLTPKSGGIKKIRYLVTVTSMRGFFGVRHADSDIWRATLNIPDNGIPVEVRFRNF